MADPLAAYRKQNGIEQAGSYDPEVVDWIRRAAREAGADPAALLATSLMESGAQRGRVGDSGTSFGPFQFHVGGALGSHTPQWANTYAAVLNRAQEFARLGVHRGQGAAAVQRPASPGVYAAGVNGLLARANTILGRSPAVAQTAAPGAPGTAQTPIPRPALSWNPQATLDFVNGFLGDASINQLTQLGQRLAQAQSGASGGIAASPSPSAAGGSPLEGSGRVISMPDPKFIGYPFQGTHTRGNWESDNAVDIALPRGTPVYAVAPGIIGSQIGSQHSSDPKLAGLRLHLKIKGNELFYQHLQQLTVHAGQRVKAGQLLGYTGALNHLHLGVRTGNPQAYA